ncbi:ribonuclease HI family protein [uncultured Aquabacterium sp.]|uniref:ribonuclease HI family protein n=1 Tax=uncultured Aquabacterium sp. TaxID=158753 RepID=UPI00262E84CE|nr:ribonuclease HI family protein [uncultured Aquabacterium sp.]
MVERKALPWRLHCDGSALPNPGRMGIGAVLVSPDGTRHTVSERLADPGCNNEAEVQALVAGLLLARSMGAQALAVYTDSDLIAKQLGAHAAPDPVRLQALLAQARTVLGTFTSHTLGWVPRHRNQEADTLARAALGMPPKPAAWPKGRRKLKR